MSSDRSTSTMFHSYLNSNASKPTIVLLHGLFGSHLEFEKITPHLRNDYNVMLVDLPGHSRSKGMPFSIANAVEALYGLIKAEIPGGKAHIAGLSLGGFVALALARTHPEVVESVFASGCAPFKTWQAWFASRPWLLYPLNGFVTKIVPDSLYFWTAARAGVGEHRELRAESKANFTKSLHDAGFEECLKVQLGEAGEVLSRTAVVAGGMQDPVEIIREMGVLLRENCEKSKAFVVEKAIHGWDLQFPELFAEGIKAWVEEDSNMPEEFVLLE